MSNGYTNVSTTMRGLIESYLDRRIDPVRAAEAMAGYIGLTGIDATRDSFRVEGTRGRFYFHMPVDIVEEDMLRCLGNRLMEQIQREIQ